MESVPLEKKVSGPSSHTLSLFFNLSPSLWVNLSLMDADCERFCGRLTTGGLEAAEAKLREAYDEFRDAERDLEEAKIKFKTEYLSMLCDETEPITDAMNKPLEPVRANGRHPSVREDGSLTNLIYHRVHTTSKNLRDECDVLIKAEKERIAVAINASRLPQFQRTALLDHLNDPGRLTEQRYYQEGWKHGPTTRPVHFVYRADYDLGIYQERSDYGPQRWRDFFCPRYVDVDYHARILVDEKRAYDEGGRGKRVKQG
jgi:hypothetical protein